MLMDPTLLLFSLGVLLVCWYLFRDRNYRLPPGPKPWPLVGNIPYLASTGKFMYQMFAELRGQYGDIVRLRVGPSQNIIVLSGFKNFHKGAVELDNKTKYRPNNLKVLNKLLGGKGVLFGNGDQHAFLRKFSLGAFRDFGVGRRGLEERIQQEASILCDKMAEDNGSPRDYLFTYKKVASNVIASIIYGDRFEYDDPDFLRAIESIDTAFKVLTPFALENFVPFVDKLPGSRMPALYKAMEYLEGYAKTKIAEHRQTFDPDNIRDFVDIFLQHEKESDGFLTDDNMFRLIVDFYNAGTDTTSLSISWAILYLVKHPRVQEKCRRQINEVVGDGELSLSHRQSVPYLQAFINEVLRVACIAAQTAPHTALEDLEFDSYIIPKNSIIFFSIYSLMHDPEVWESPEEFRPERFLSIDGKLAKGREQFAPFGMGGRSCLGKQLANSELFLFLGNLIQRFEFKCPPTKTPAQLSSRIIQTGITSQPEPYEICAVPVRESG